MSPTYTVKVLTEFSAAHHLRDYVGDCARVHGHNWKVEIEVQANALNKIGMAMDFKDVKEAANRIIQRLDHQDINALEPFTTINPTAENLATYIYRELSQLVNDSRIRVSAIAIWETDRSCVRYTEE
ncbi:MAG: 6-carboxytetrahydropterin synthase QueD [Gammaproteobacteria bacterium]|nr:6-carboxytetrahydropterin synthase QueD [Gammaproteobacteria bacterium]